MKSRNEITEELKSLSPYLASLSREHPFYTSENYFTEAEESILAAISGKEIFSPLVASATDQPFELPASYFEMLPETILSRIKKQSSPVIRRLPSRSVWLAAASIAILFFSSILVYNYQHQQSDQLVQEQIAITTDEESSLMMNVSDIDDDAIVQLLIEYDATTGSTATSTDPSLIDVIEIDDAYLDQI
ncbi:MAG: hypothetical protein IPO83_05935 [Chitinophagaceae bacterium]|nr:hypothetical protein [Chitinophagaceae bacterium]